MMKNLFLTTIFLMTSMVSGLSAQAPDPPERAVANLYKADKAKDVSEMSKAELRKYFSETLANNLRKAYVEDRVEFAILYDTDDNSDLKNFKITPAVIKKNGTDLYATVKVTFINFGEKKRIDFQLSKATSGSWRIINVFYYHQGRNFNLAEILKK